MPFDHSPPFQAKGTSQSARNTSTDFSVSLHPETPEDDIARASRPSTSSFFKSASSEEHSEAYHTNPARLHTSSNHAFVSETDYDEESENNPQETVIPPEIILGKENTARQDVIAKVVQSPNSYGIGLDVHNKFIVVTVLVQRRLEIMAYTKEFDTSRDGIQKAYFWSVSVIEKNSDPAVDIFPLHYTLESTATMHFPILKIWGGDPAVVNPTLAKAGRRKSDVIDSIQLSRFDMDGAWPRTYVISDEIHTLRVLINEKDHFNRLATQCNNRICNTLTRFGCTLSREGSVTGNEGIRCLLEGIIAEIPVSPSDYCPTVIPEETRAMLREELSFYDSYKKQEAKYAVKMMAHARSMIWETGEGSLTGDEMIALLTTAPQIGEYTAVVFLANIITPRRFPTPKALAAYCGLDPSVQVSAGKKTSRRGRGGNKPLHKVMTAAANRLLKNHSEMFGIWGYNLLSKGTSRNKCRNAIARRLAVALYYMMLYGQPFSYEKYKMASNMTRFDIPVEDLIVLNQGFKRYIPILQREGINTSSDLIRAYVSCELDHIKGLGRKFFSLVKDLLANQKKYKCLYDDIMKEDGTEDYEADD